MHHSCFHKHKHLIISPWILVIYIYIPITLYKTGKSHFEIGEIGVQIVNPIREVKFIFKRQVYFCKIELFQTAHSI